MTDVSTERRRGPRRGVPLVLEDNVLELIADGRSDLRNRSGKPVMSRIAAEAGIHKQRLSGADITDLNTLGALVRCYANVHGVSDKEAMAAVLRLPDNAETTVAA